MRGNKSYQVMADALGVAKATISYELDRVKPYDPELAQQDADRKRRNCGRRSMLTAALATLITNHLRLTWSPETIAAAYNLSTASIYNWLNRGWLPFKLTDLPNRNVRQHRVSENRGKFTSGTSIEQRPTTVNQRLAFGHWEVDTVLSSRSESRSCLVTFVERKTRLLWAIKAPNRTAKALNTAFGKFMGAFGPQVKSITTDNGSEFADLSSLEDVSNTLVYYAHPYTSCDKGTVERHNGLIRRFIPKGEAIDNYSLQDIIDIETWCNSLPRKILAYHTPDEIFERELDLIYQAA